MDTILYLSLYYLGFGTLAISEHQLDNEAVVNDETTRPSMDDGATKVHLVDIGEAAGGSCSMASAGSKGSVRRQRQCSCPSTIERSVMSGPWSL